MPLPDYVKAAIGEQEGLPEYVAAVQPPAYPTPKIPAGIERRKLAFKPTGKAVTPEQRRVAGKRIVEEQIAPILETGGMIIGGALGAVGGPPGAIAGAGLGYATAERVAGALAGEKVKPIGEEALEFAKETLTGAALEATGIGIGKVVGKIAESASRKLYESAVKFSTKLTHPERAKFAQAGLDKAIFPTEKGLVKLGSKIDDVNQGINRAIKRASQKGEVQTSKVASEIDKVKDRFKHDIDYDEITESLESLKTKLLAKGPTMAAHQAQDMKVLAYKSLKNKYGELKSATIEGKKGLAKGLMQELERLYPDIKGLNQAHATMRGLEKEITRAAGRISNRELLSLLATTTAAAGGAATQGPEGLTYGLAVQLMTSPRSKVAMGIALNKALKAAGSSTTVRRGLAPFLIPEKENNL